MSTITEQEVRLLIEQATQPLTRRLDYVEREARRVKSELQNVKSTLARIKR